MYYYAGDQLEMSRLFVLEHGYYFFVQADYACAYSDIMNRLFFGERPFCYDAVYVPAPESDPVFFPSGFLVGAVGMPFIREKEQDGP